MRERGGIAHHVDARTTLRIQLSSLRTVMLLAYMPLAVVLGLAVALRLSTGVAIADLTRDALFVTDAPVYTGILSTAGGLIWAAAAAICFFCYAILRNRLAQASEARFLLAGGFVTMMLLLDDVFMLHETVYPDYLGMPQNAVLVLTAVMLLWFVVSFRAIILRTDFLLLLLAFAGFALSIGIDVVHSTINWLPAM